jgi:hypothetical protein
LTDTEALKLVSGKIDVIETRWKSNKLKDSVMGYRLAKNDNGLFEEKEVTVISDLVAENIATKLFKSLWSKCLTRISTARLYVLPTRVC